VNPAAGTFGWVLDPEGQTLSLIYTPTAVPEPGTLAPVGLAAAQLAVVRGRWRPSGGQVGPLLTYCILSTAGNDTVRPMHDPIPVIMPPVDIGQ
jgi:hypothetical protein